MTSKFKAREGESPGVEENVRSCREIRHILFTLDDSYHCWQIGAGRLPGMPAHVSQIFVGIGTKAT